MTALDAISLRHTKWKSSCRGLLTLFTLYLALDPCAGCPSQVERLCGCVDELDGVLLNCSNVDAVQLLNVLRAQQSQLGLLKALSIQHSSPIRVLPPNFFAGLYIKRLELVNCGIRTVENGAFSGLEPVLQELNMVNNLLSNIPVAAIASMSSILKLDFSNNSIEELKFEDALPRLPKLFDINLSHNLISNVHKSFFENAKGSLQTINLGHNNISEVPAPALRGFRKLMALHLHNNNLHSIQMLSFMNLPVLSLLNLASNKITTIHRQAFLNTPTLRFLYMTDNQMAEVVAHQFSSFEQLEMIDLSSNRIEILHNDSFSNLPSVRQIYLGENRIARIEDYAFANSSVVILVLEANHLTEVKKGMFQGCTKVQQISLKDNKIKNVDPNAFYNNGALVMVDLSHNELLDLAPATFLSQLNMLLVDLSYNKLLRTPYSAFNRRVVTVLLKENPLVCGEKVHMLQQGVGVYVPNSEDIICRGQHSIGSTMLGGLQGSKDSTIANNPNSSPFSNLPEMVKSVGAEESGSFVQAPTPNTESPALQPPNSDRQHSLLSNIRPIISDKRISTADINQFVEASQFPDINQPTYNSLAPSFPSSSTPIIHPVEEQPQQTQHPQPSSPHPTTSNHPSHEEVDIANDPNQIYPLPVPFLTRPPKIHTAHNVGNDVVVTQTLPPSIVIAAGPPRPALSTSSEETSSNSEAEKPTSTESRLEEVELQQNNVGVKSASMAEEVAAAAKFPYDFEQDGQQGGQAVSKTLPTAIIVICLSTVGLVMSAVFVGMCVAKRRQIRLIGSSNGSCATVAVPGHTPASYMAAAAAHHAAQMNAQMMYGTGTLTRGSTGTLNRMPPLQDDIYGWLYTPQAYNGYPK